MSRIDRNRLDLALADAFGDSYRPVEPARAAAWLASVPANRLAQLDQQVRWRGSDLYPKPTPAQVRERVQGPHGWAALGFASMMPDGHMREAAVVELARRRERELAFLLLRVNDWVPAVRTRALTALHERLVPARAPELVGLLPLVETLASQSRHDHRALVAAIVDSVAAPGQEAARAGFTSPDVAVRRACLRLLAGRPGVQAAALADRDAALRGQALARVGPEEIELVRPLLRDPVGPLRCRALGLLVARGVATDDELRAALLERHDGTRVLARREGLRRGFDVLAAYRAGIDAGQPGAVLGLAEIAPAEVDRVRAVLASPRPGLRRAAVRGLGWISGDFGEDLVTALADPSLGVVAEARRQLLVAPVRAPLDRLSALVQRDDVWMTARLAALDVLAAGAKWRALVEILRAAATSVPALAAAAEQLQLTWLREYNRRLVPPTADELAAARALLPAAGRLRDRLARILADEGRLRST